MSKKLTLEQAVAGIAQKNVATERARLVEKWNRSGLLRGLDGTHRETMAQLLENQAAQLLKEANTISTGGANLVSSNAISGFSTIAFPIIRRVFANLIAKDLVSIQPMNVPSGMVFFLDYVYGSNVGGNAGLRLDPDATEMTYNRGQSIYGTVAGSGIISGSHRTGGFFDLANTGYTRVHTGSLSVHVSGSDIGAWSGAGNAWTSGGTVASVLSGSNARHVSYDPSLEADLMDGVYDIAFLHIPASELANKLPTGDQTYINQIAITNLGTPGGAVPWGLKHQIGTSVYNLRRLNRRGNFNGTSFTLEPHNGTHFQFVIRLTKGGAVPTPNNNVHVSMTVGDRMVVDAKTGATVTIPSFETDYSNQSSPVIPEIDIRIESISLTAVSRKLRARWSPELAQDLNAYHSLDAEVELTNILSEQVALEIDREVLNDLLTLATGANLFWSATPGMFVNKWTGQPQQMTSSLSGGPFVTGGLRDWYETLTTVIITAANQIQAKTLRSSANFIVVGPDVASILESSVQFRVAYTLDGNGQVGDQMTIGSERIGTLTNRFTVFKDPFFPRNKILVGYKGTSNMDTGYVYAPYVPLIVTPTIYRPDDFSPTKGVMTRYAKKMLRSDYYGTITILNSNIF